VDAIVGDTVTAAVAGVGSCVGAMVTAVMVGEPADSPFGRSVQPHVNMTRKMTMSPLKRDLICPASKSH
jgi:hypothetical protein